MILDAKTDDRDSRRGIRAWLRRQALMEDVEWLLDQGCSGYDIERALQGANLHSLERLAQRHNRYDIARRVSHVAKDKSQTSPGKPADVRYPRYKEAS